MSRPSRLPFLCLLGLLTPLCAHAAPDPLPWDAKAQGDFVVSLARDRQGSVWAGTEDDGVSRYSPTTHQWTRFTTKDGLGDDDVYALCVDKRGRVWAGTLNHGVSVWNGRAWKTYDRLAGPLGAHVTALAVCPADGSVWGATEAGLFRYAHDAWTYVTRAEGLPSDQANALAFDKAGNLYVGTQCDGLAIASASSGYKTWRRVTGPDALPNTPSGKNLPSNLVNVLLVAKDGTVYVGTDGGLAWSRDEGDSWHYTRGADFEEKNKNLYKPQPTVQTPVTGDLLLGDYVTALAEDAGGRVLVGHQQRGVEVLDSKTLKRVYPIHQDTIPNAYTFALLAAGPTVLEGRYGGGLTQAVLSGGASPEDASSRAASPQEAPAAPFPAPAKAPSVESLQALTRQVQSLKGEFPVGGAAYLGEDWATQGDWVGRYGRKLAILCAARSPLDHDIQAEFPYSAKVKMGPHHDKDDGVRNYCSVVQADSPKALYDPIPGYRRQAEWDDHGEVYNRAYEGPDLWIAVNVPEGVQRLSFYFVNKDGHTEDNSQRDFTLELKPWQEDLETADAQPTLARTRVENFWGGVYKSFVVRGPSKYWVKLARNYSKNTIISAVLMDKLKGPVNIRDAWPLGWMGGVHYDPPDPDAPVPPDPHALDKLLAMQAAGTQPPVKTAA